MTAIDALSIIDDINTNGPTLLHEQFEGSGVCSLDTLAGPWNELAGCFQVWSGGGLLADVNPDDRISPLDVLIVINRINASVVGEGEADGFVAVGGMAGELDSGFMPGIGANPINDLAVHAILGEWTNPEFGFEGRIDDHRIKRASMEFTDPAGADVSLAAAKDDATAGYGRSVDLLFDAEGQNRLDLDLLGDRLSVLRADA